MISSERRKRKELTLGGIITLRCWGLRATRGTAGERTELSCRPSF